jgi:glycosyltransferase involved in cell wall biosynthesis
MKMINPKISVIIPIYNDKLYLTDALKSIQQQTFTDFECICVNDGSTDESEEIIDDFVKHDGRFSKINRQNGGVSAARNTGLNVASGDYLFFMDHDDLIPSYTLELLLDTAQKFGADMSRGLLMMIAEDFRMEELPKAENGVRKPRYFDNPITDFYKHIRGKYKSWCYVWQCLFRRDTIRNVRFVEDLRAGGEDNLFMFEAVGAIKNFVQIDNITACHRYSKTSATLNGYNSTLIKMFETIVPYVYKNYRMVENIDKRMLRWVYRKESYAVYRILIRNTIRLYDQNYLSMARDVLLKLNGTPEFDEIIKRWNFLQKAYFRLFINGKFDTLRKLKIFMHF